MTPVWEKSAGCVTACASFDVVCDCRTELARLLINRSNLRIFSLKKKTDVSQRSTIQCDVFPCADDRRGGQVVRMLSRAPRPCSEDNEAGRRHRHRHSHLSSDKQSCDLRRRIQQLYSGKWHYTEFSHTVNSVIVVGLHSGLQRNPSRLRYDHSQRCLV